MKIKSTSYFLSIITGLFGLFIYRIFPVIKEQLSGLYPTDHNFNIVTKMVLSFNSLFWLIIFLIVAAIGIVKDLKFNSAWGNVIYTIFLIISMGFVLLGLFLPLDVILEAIN